MSFGGVLAAQNLAVPEFVWIVWVPIAPATERSASRFPMTDVMSIGPLGMLSGLSTVITFTTSKCVAGLISTGFRRRQGTTLHTPLHARTMRLVYWGTLSRRMHGRMRSIG